MAVRTAGCLPLVGGWSSAPTPTVTPDLAGGAEVYGGQVGERGVVLRKNDAVVGTLFADAAGSLTRVETSNRDAFVPTLQAGMRELGTLRAVVPTHQIAMFANAGFDMEAISEDRMFAKMVGHRETEADEEMMFALDGGYQMSAELDDDGVGIMATLTDAETSEPIGEVRIDLQGGGGVDDPLTATVRESIDIIDGSPEGTQYSSRRMIETMLHNSGVDNVEFLDGGFGYGVQELDRAFDDVVGHHHAMRRTLEDTLSNPATPQGRENQHLQITTKTPEYHKWSDKLSPTTEAQVATRKHNKHGGLVQATVNLRYKAEDGKTKTAYSRNVWWTNVMSDALVSVLGAAAENKYVQKVFLRDIVAQYLLANRVFERLGVDFPENGKWKIRHKAGDIVDELQIYKDLAQKHINVLNAALKASANPVDADKTLKDFRITKGIGFPTARRYLVYAAGPQVTAESVQKAYDDLFKYSNAARVQFLTRLPPPGDRREEMIKKLHDIKTRDRRRAGSPGAAAAVIPALPAVGIRSPSSALSHHSRGSSPSGSFGGNGGAESPASSYSSHNSGPSMPAASSSVPPGVMDLLGRSPAGFESMRSPVRRPQAAAAAESVAQRTRAKKKSPARRPVTRSSNQRKTRAEKTSPEVEAAEPVAHRTRAKTLAQQNLHGGEVRDISIRGYDSDTSTSSGTSTGTSTGTSEDVEIPFGKSDDEKSVTAMPRFRPAKNSARSVFADF